MEKFEDYIREDEAVRATIAKLPESHRALVKGYDFRFEPGNTLKDDPGHVGRVYIDGNDKTITIASPWRWGRETVLLHETAHLVYAEFVKGKEWEDKWRKVYKSEPGPKKEGAEEAFCHAYANFFAENKVSKFDLKPWSKFMADFCG